MERAYREDELLDASIIDSEGYVYGKVDKIRIDENEIILLAYEGKPDVKTVADVDYLKAELLKGVRMPFGSRFRRAAASEMLEENMRKELGLGFEEQLNDGHYLKYAEKLNMAVPQVKATVERKEQKGTVTLDEIKTIRITVIGKEKGTKVIKVIMLQEPKEAAFRRIPVQKKVPFRSSDVIKDKLVLDSEGSALGYVDSVVLFQGMPGIRVYIQKMSGQVSLSLLSRYLDESGQSEAASILRKDLMEREREAHRYTVDMDELEDFLRQNKLSFRLPEKVLASQIAKEFVTDIPWDEISKIGDVVILKSTLADLRSKGHI